MKASTEQSICHVTLSRCHAVTVIPACMKKCELTPKCTKIGIFYFSLTFSALSKII